MTHRYENENEQTHRKFPWQPLQCQPHDFSIPA